MSAFTDRLYRSWAAQNGYSGPRTRDVRGYGGCAPHDDAEHAYRPCPAACV